jgi:uncharacterized protein YukE
MDSQTDPSTPSHEVVDILYCLENMRDFAKDENMSEHSLKSDILLATLQSKMADITKTLEGLSEMLNQERCDMWRPI